MTRTRTGVGARAAGAARTVVALAAGLALCACGSGGVGEDTHPGGDGARVDRLHGDFDNGEYRSDYHVFASGLDAARPIGLLVYADGSGGEGFHDPDTSYLLDADGQDGLVAMARRHNMVLLTPVAPPPGCDNDGNVRPDRGEDANCWYDPGNAQGKAQWSSDLVHHVTNDLGLDPDRVVVAGFSSGAQWATQYWAPAHGEEHDVDLTIAIGYGGEPMVDPRFTEEYVSRTAFAWDTGTADEAYSADTYGSIGGYTWYTAQGFRTHATWPAGMGHDRPGEFHLIVEREMERVLGAD